MLNEQTHQKLMTMKLFGLAAAYKQHLNEGGDNQLSFDERFGLMVDQEFDQRAERKLKCRLGRAKLREPACIEDINYRHPRGLDRSLMQRLATCQWVKNHENIIFTGQTGVGKTWLACALTDKTCREGYTAFYVRTPRLLQSLNLARADGSYAAALAKLAKTDVLILDDWGLAPLSDFERRDVLEVFEDRHNRRSTIITSQLPVKKWHEHIGDPTIADSILDRVIHHAHRIDLKGPTLRDPLADKKNSGG
jgi:DNA replication protein DnaC